MKKVLFVLMVFALGVACCGNGYAEDIFATDVDLTDRWNIGVNTSVFMPKEGVFSNGVQVQGLVSYDIFKFLALGVEGGWTGAIGVETDGVDFGTLNAWSVLGDVILKAPVEVGDFLLVPYMVNGFGGVFPSFDESDTLSSFNMSVDYEPAFIYKLGGGFDFYITELSALGFEVSYQWADIKGKAELNGSEIASGTDKYDALYLGGRVKVKF